MTETARGKLQQRVSRSDASDLRLEIWAWLSTSRYYADSMLLMLYLVGNNGIKLGSRTLVSPRTHGHGKTSFKTPQPPRQSRRSIRRAMHPWISGRWPRDSAQDFGVPCGRMICSRMLPRKCKSSLQASQSNWVEAYQEAPPTCSIVVTCGTCTTLRKQQHHSTRRPILPILETPVKLAPPPHPQVIDQSDFCVALVVTARANPFSKSRSRTASPCCCHITVP